MKTVIGGGYRPAQSAEAEALRERFERRPRGHALVVSDGAEPLSATILSVLSGRELEPRVVVGGSAELPDPASVKLIVLTGTEPYATARTDPERERELDWLRAADAVGTPVLGIGHGARALADALGGAVQDAAVAYTGWTFVDTIAPHQIAAGPWLAWQHDLIGLPSSAQLIAHNRLGAQAFRIGPHLGVQFHPEATTADAAGWAATSPDPISTSRMVHAARRDPGAAHVCAQRLYTTFLDTL
jgi:GMP synthase-like glutamine amidotransferase